MLLQIEWDWPCSVSRTQIEQKLAAFSQFSLRNTTCSFNMGQETYCMKITRMLSEGPQFSKIVNGISLEFYLYHAVLCDDTNHP